jgi:hypothetical protein
VSGDGGNRVALPGVTRVGFPDQNRIDKKSLHNQLLRKFQGCPMNSKGQRKANGSFELAETPSHLMRRCHQYFGDLYALETGARDLTKQQFTCLRAGAS